LGPYVLLSALGQGGMGQVYLAQHATTQQRVALKTVKVPSQVSLQSLRREIQALARLRHPGIVRILEEGLHQGVPWYAMELLEGQDLLSWRRDLLGPARASQAPSTARTLWWTRSPTLLDPPKDGAVDPHAPRAIAPAPSLSPAQLRAILTV